MAQLPPWATQPLPSQYDYGVGGFQQLAQYATQQHNTYNQMNTAQPIRVCPIVPSYASANQRTQHINNAHPADQLQYQAGSTVGAAVPYYPVGQGGIGMVTSMLGNAAYRAETSENDWHTVGVMRMGPTVWIADPGYVMDSQTRLPMIPGTANVSRLLNNKNFGNVDLVQVQGWSSNNADCMGRSAQWVDNVLGVPQATMPYPPGTFVTGQVTPGWQVVRQT